MVEVGRSLEVPHGLDCRPGRIISSLVLTTRHQDLDDAFHVMTAWGQRGIVAGLSVVLFACGGGAIPPAKSGGALLPAKVPVPYVVPLQLAYAHWDHHLLQWLPNHPRYEMIEALVNDDSGFGPWQCHAGRLLPAPG